MPLVLNNLYPLILIHPHADVGAVGPKNETAKQLIMVRSGVERGKTEPFVSER